MAAGTPMILVLLLMVLVFGDKFLQISTGVSKPQNFTGVKIPGGHMELVEHETCSKGVIRLTCRSLRAFLIILEATYFANRSDLCGNDVERREKSMKVNKIKVKYLRGNYPDDDDDQADLDDLRISLNRRCSGLQHCRFNVDSDHPEAVFWTPSNIRLKYACIPEAAISKYCNTKLSVSGGEGGYLKSPGYPHYYLGGSSCGWTFESQPGQRISLTLHDLNIRNAQQDGSCVDVIRVRENGVTLLESCGTSAGVQVVSQSNLITLDLIALSNLYPSRGFLLQYRAVGCPEVKPPNGSYVVNATADVKTFLCKTGTVFPDTKIRSKLIRCKNGLWSEERVKSCVDTSALLLKAGRESGSPNTRSLSDDSGLGDSIYIPPIGIAERSNEHANAMPASHDKNMEDGNYVVDIVLPSVFIALLFIGNAIIVYVIFQYRKRKQPSIGRGDRGLGGEEMALRSPIEEYRQV